ncbi:ABC transporter permease [archaeon]|jgi:putative ABC transport system permease protein|nr:ABC transporter permease [archaeon]MBT3577862.1 ABC transporter permease [archaeon]MBT6819774.1 ABC transporter permease [archaeon]MBT6955888.1 ABC transporter permease [archaeon]MBT7025556.1 ABC transporter permease [archaeon]
MVISEESIKYSLRNLKHRKARSFLTILSIFIGIATIFIFISYGWGLYDYIGELSSSSSADKLIIQAKGGAGIPGLDDTFKLTDDDLEAIEKTSGVEEVTGLRFKVAEVQQGTVKKYTFLISYDPEKPLMMEFSNIEVGFGRDLNKGEKGKLMAGYSYQVPDAIFSKAYEVNDNLEVNGEKMKIVGFYESVGSPPDDAQIYITNDYMEELYPGEELSYGWIIARVDVDNIDQIIERIEKNLRKERGLDKGKEDFHVQSFQDMIEAFGSALNIIIGFVVLIALISVVVSAVNTANTMITSVLERIKEIGIIKSIGGRNSEVFKIFLFESAFLGFVAGVIGVGLGWIVSYGGGILLDNLGWGFLSPHFSVLLFVGLILFATLTGAISGVIPAIRASKINPVDALRYE